MCALMCAIVMCTLCGSLLSRLMIIHPGEQQIFRFLNPHTVLQKQSLAALFKCKLNEPLNRNNSQRSRVNCGDNTMKNIQYRKGNVLFDWESFGILSSTNVRITCAILAFGEDMIPNDSQNIGLIDPVLLFSEDLGSRCFFTRDVGLASALPMSRHLI